MIEIRKAASLPSVQIRSLRLARKKGPMQRGTAAPKTEPPRVALNLDWRTF